MRFAMILTMVVIGCGRVHESPADSAALIESSVEVSTDVTQVDSRPEVDAAEYCPDPDYPPRMDGCPCRPGDPARCNEANKGKACVYKALCPTFATRYTCILESGFEKEPTWTWKLCNADCATGECVPLPDSGMD